MGSLFRLCQVSFIPWHFKLDDSSSLRGSIEERRGKLCFHLKCLLLAVG